MRRRARGIRSRVACGRTALPAPPPRPHRRAPDKLRNRGSTPRYRGSWTSELLAVTGGIDRPAGTIDPDRRPAVSHPTIERVAQPPPDDADGREDHVVEER